jgi:hypothetical protein
VAIPSRRSFLRWFHAVEDDEARNPVLVNGWELTQAAVADDLIAAEDSDGFAALVIALADDDLLDFDAPGRHTEEFGSQPAYHLQQASQLRSTAKGRAWLRESDRGATITVSGGAVGQIAGRDITNITIAQVFERAEAEIERADAPREQREEARKMLQSLRMGASDFASGTGAALAAQAIGRALGLS